MQEMDLARRAVGPVRQKDNNVASEKRR
jgi:hypothetical protein